MPVDLIICVRGERLSHLSIISHSPPPKKLFARLRPARLRARRPWGSRCLTACEFSAGTRGLGGWQVPVALTECDASAWEAPEAACSAECRGAWATNRGSRRGWGLRISRCV